MRGYGQSDQPEAIDQYTLLHLVGDMVGLLDAIGEDTAVIAGHDWGAPVAWHAALLRPDRFRAVIGLSVPYRPRGRVRPTSVMPQTEDAVFYQLHFQTPGVAEAELQQDVRAFISGTLLRLSGDAPSDVASFGMVPRVGGMLARDWALGPMPLPAWITGADVDFYAAEFTRTGFRGGLNWYRNIDRNWELLAPFAGARVSVPALYVAADRDLVLTFPGAAELVANLKQFVPRLARTVVLPGCGHWTQQERPEEVNAALIDFLRSL
jgi:pimeloyl-ACP methyl ester carboxylesterase